MNRLKLGDARIGGEASTPVFFYGAQLPAKINGFHPIPPESTTCDGCSMRTIEWFAPPMLKPPRWMLAEKVSPPAKPSIAPPFVLRGVPIDRVNMAEALDRIDRMITSGKPHYVVTANADFLTQAGRDVELRRILLESHLVLCDGTPLVWASRLLGCPLPERVAGSDMAPLLLAQAAKKGYRLFLLGASPETNALAVERLKVRYPDLNIVGNYAPPFKPLLEMDHEEINKRIRTAAPDLLLVSFGCPKQEKWMAMHYESLQVPVCMGVGATIDFLASRVKRAPRWMHKTGLEWTFRLAQEPKRLFKRYLDDFFHFGAATLAQLWEMRFRPRSAVRVIPSEFSLSDTPIAHSHVWAGTVLNFKAVERDADVWRKAVAHERHCLLDLADVVFIDSAGMGMIALLHKQLMRTGHRLVLLAPSREVQRALRLMGLDELFLFAPNLDQGCEILGKLHCTELKPAVQNVLDLAAFHSGLLAQGR